MKGLNSGGTFLQNQSDIYVPKRSVKVRSYDFNLI